MPRTSPPKKKGPFWYNEVPPSVFFNAHLLKEGRAPIYHQKWQREILDQHLDLNQRQILKDERAARIYLNAPPLQLQPKQDAECMRHFKELNKINKSERENVETHASRHLANTIAIYGLNGEELGLHKKKPKPVITAKGPLCSRMRRLPPYLGPYALHVLPWDTSLSKPGKSRYQVKIYRDKVAGHEMSETESRDLKQYSTTPQAVWRQHRFATPEGCQFKDIKEQIKAAKHKAMLTLRNKHDNVVVGHAKLTSHFKPWTGQADDDPDCEDLQEDKVLMEKARLEMNYKLRQLRAARRDASNAIAQARRQRQGLKTGSGATEDFRYSTTFTEGSEIPEEAERPSETTQDQDENEDEDLVEALVRNEPGGKRVRVRIPRKQKSQKRPSEHTQMHKESEEEKKKSKENFFKQEPQFSVYADFLEDLQQEDQESRKQLAELFKLQPLGNFYPDPRMEPSFALCYETEKREARMSIVMERKS